MQSQDDRDAEGFVARRERERDAIVKDHADDEFTDRYEGAELEQARASRPEVERIGRLEKKHDELKADVEKRHDELKRDVEKRHDELRHDVDEVRSDIKEISGQVSGMRAEVSGAVGKIDGQETVLTEMLSIVKKTAVQTLERDHVSFTVKAEVDKAHELASIEVGKEEQLATIKVAKEEKVDVVKAKRDRRRRNRAIIALVASGLAGGGVLIELLHRIGVL